MPRFAISDIHGCPLTFKALLDKIQLTTQDELYLLGDFIDRGPDSKGVIDQVWQLQKDGYTVHCTRGNHEQLLLGTITDHNSRRIWMKHGGIQTLESFGAMLPEDIPSEYMQFFRDLPYYLELPDEYILVHAGLDFSDEDPLQDPRPMLWIRPWDMQFDLNWLNGRVIVHGHTPISEEEIRSQLLLLPNHPAINIDAGCVYSRLQKLCALDLDSRELYFQDNVD